MKLIIDSIAQMICIDFMLKNIKDADLKSIGKFKMHYYISLNCILITNIITSFHNQISPIIKNNGKLKKII